MLFYLAGEVPWVKRSFQKHNEKAKDKGICIVHCCGYDRSEWICLRRNLQLRECVYHT